MPDHRPPRDLAAELADQALRSLGHAPTEPGEHHVGTMNRVICYPQSGLAVRLSPP